MLVSEGPQREELRLADNMAGAEFLPQVSVLPQVDLVITHAGNNTVTVPAGRLGHRAGGRRDRASGGCRLGNHAQVAGRATAQVADHRVHQPLVVAHLPVGHRVDHPALSL